MLGQLRDCAASLVYRASPTRCTSPEHTTAATPSSPDLVSLSRPACDRLPRDRHTRAPLGKCSDARWQSSPISGLWPRNLLLESRQRHIAIGPPRRARNNTREARSSQGRPFIHRTQACQAAAVCMSSMVDGRWVVGSVRRLARVPWLPRHVRPICSAIARSSRPGMGPVATRVRLSRGGCYLISGVEGLAGWSDRARALCLVPAAIQTCSAGVGLGLELSS